MNIKGGLDGGQGYGGGGCVWRYQQQCAPTPAVELGWRSERGVPGMETRAGTGATPLNFPITWHSSPTRGPQGSSGLFVIISAISILKGVLLFV